MKKNQLTILVLLTFCLISESSASNTAYVTDTFTITLRTGPSTENKIIKFLSSGQLLDVIEKNEKWSRVRVLGNGEEKMEGWVLKENLIERIPYRIQVDTLMNENRKLKEKLGPINEQLNELSKEKKDLFILYQKSQTELDKLKGEFDFLKESSSEYLKLKAEYEGIRSKLESSEKRVKELEAENANLNMSQRNIWFATGALVLLCGLMIGFMAGRQARKRASSYY